MAWLESEVVTQDCHLFTFHEFQDLIMYCGKTILLIITIMINEYEVPLSTCIYTHDCVLCIVKLALAIQLLCRVSWNLHQLQSVMAWHLLPHQQCV